MWRHTQLHVDTSTSKYNKIVNCGEGYRDCIKGMETRPGCRVHAIMHRVSRGQR